MGGLRDILAGHQVISFLVLTFVFSWYFWSAAAWVPGSRDLYLVLGGLGPSLVGLVLIFLLDGEGGVRRVLSKMLPGDVHPFWFLFSPFGALAIALPGILFSVYLGGEGYVLGDLSTVYQVVVSFVAVFAFSVVGEEIGWRGFILPRLQRDAVAAVSGIVLGAVWGIWQIPLWYVPGHAYQSIPLPIFLVYVAGVSVLCTWLYNNTCGNLLVVSLFHATSYAALGLLLMLSTRAEVGLLPMLASTGTLWVLVGVIAVIYGSTYLSRDEKYSFLGGFSWEDED